MLLLPYLSGPDYKNIPFLKAEEIKKKFANVDYNFYDTLNKINIGDVKLDRNKTTLNIRLYNIVNDRVKELLTIVKEKIEAYGFMHTVPCGVVITGGSANLKEIKSLAKTVFDMPSRIGNAIDVEGHSSAINDPVYSTGIGLLKYANQIRNFEDLGRFEDRTRSKGIIGRFRDFISRVLANEKIE